MEFLTQILDTIYENFFDPRKRVFVGYLFSAIVISFLWLCVLKKNTLRECFYKIFDKRIFKNIENKSKLINLKIYEENLKLFNINLVLFVLCKCQLLIE